MKTSSKRKAPAEPEGKQSLASAHELPAQLMAVSLNRVHCGGSLAKASKAEKTIIHIDTKNEVKAAEVGALAFVSVRCRVASREQPEQVLVDFLATHQLAYKFNDTSIGEAFVKQNVLFHAWPYARALFSDIMGRMGLQRPTLPLLAAGVVAVESQLTRLERQGGEVVEEAAPEPPAPRKRTRKA
jgi:hypothetical protein